MLEVPAIPTKPLPVEHIVLKTTLSEPRKKELHDQLLESTNEIERITDLMARQKAEQGAIVKRQQARQIESAHTLKDGYEMLAVPCQRVVDKEAGVVRVIRQDTKEVVSEKPLADPLKPEIIPPATSKKEKRHG